SSSRWSACLSSCPCRGGWPGMGSPPLTRTDESDLTVWQRALAPARRPRHLRSQSSRAPPTSYPGRPSRSHRAALIVFAVVAGVGTIRVGAETPASLAVVAGAAPEARLPGADVDSAPGAAFLRDTTLTLHLRTFYFDGTQTKGTENEAWAGGG